MRETQGEKVSALVLFEQTVDMSAVANVSATQLHEKAAKGLGEGIMTHHENKKGKLDSVINSFLAGTQIGVPICFTECPHLSSLAAELWIPCCPLLARSRNPLEQGLTHTGSRNRRRCMRRWHRALFLKKTPACCWIMSLVDVQPDKLFSRCRCGVWWKGVCINCM